MSGTYIGKFIATVASALEFNSATLSGAIDVIVTEDENGVRRSTPFYVRFGKLQLLKSRGIPVDIVLNDETTDLRMYLGAAGEAYFFDPALADKFQTTSGEFPFSDDPDVNNPPNNPVVSDAPNRAPHQSDPSLAIPDPDLQNAALPPPVSAPLEATLLKATKSDPAPDSFPISPEIAHSYSHPDDDMFYTRAIRSTSDLGFSNFAYLSDSEMELTRGERDGTVQVVEEPRSPPCGDLQRRWSSQWARSRTILRTQSAKHPPVSEKVPTTSSSLPADPQQHGEDQLSSLFGLPESGNDDSNDEESVNGTTRSHNMASGTIISASFTEAQVELDEEMKMELRSVDGCEEQSGLMGSEIEEQLARALDSQEDSNESEGVIEMSLCGEHIRDGMSERDRMAIFNEHKVSRADFEEDPSILHDNALLFRIEDRLVGFKVAAPFVMAMLAYRTPMDLDYLSQMVSEPVDEKPVSPAPRRFGGWFGWSSPKPVGEPLLDQDERDAIEEQEKIKNGAEIGESSSMLVEKDSERREIGSDDIEQSEVEESEIESGAEDQSAYRALENTNSILEGRADALTTEVVEEAFERQDSGEAIFAEADYDSECFSFMPSNEDLAALNLQPGANEIRFVISSRSACELRCRIFLWRSDSKVVISDVDGTITRSDVLGHLLPGVGLDWSQVGVAGLYSLIVKNGYKMLYLTARPIGQASQTRDFLQNVTQGSDRLPNGPLLMSPNRLVESFTREVIRRKPHEFKIACLRDVRTLFPLTYNPFHAGFGNRDTDVISYRAVGLIPQRIFVVNPKGEIVVMKAMYESTASYSSLQTLVENVFPDISGKSGVESVLHATETATYNDWNYWRGTLPDLDLDELLKEP